MDLPDLRPLSFGELLDRTFTYYRRHFWTFVGIMAVPQVLIVAVSVGFQALQARLISPADSRAPGVEFSGQMAGATVVGTVLIMIIYFAVYSVALGAATHAVSEIHLGRTVSVRAAYRSMRGRYLRLADLVITLLIRIVLIYILVMFGSFMIAGASVAILGAVVGREAPTAMVALMGILVIGLLLVGAFLAAWFILRYGCAIPAMLVENIKASAAIKRSVQLTKGNVWRVFLVTVLMTLVSWTVILIFQGPFYVVLFLMAAKSHGQPPPLWLTAIMNVSGGVGGALTGSLIMIGLALLYYDIRVRKEGFDLQVMMATLDAQSPVEGVVSQTPLPAPLELEHKSVLLVILLTVVTFGLYYPYWFIRSKKGINSLNSQRKINLIIPGFVFSVWLLRFVLVFVWAALSESGALSRLGFIANAIQGVPELDSIVTLVGGILLLLQCFKVKSILEDHTNVPISGPLAGSLTLVQRTTFSGVATFFLGIYYLQYKINEIVDASPQASTAVGVIPGL